MEHQPTLGSIVLALYQGSYRKGDGTGHLALRKCPNESYRPLPPERDK